MKSDMTFRAAALLAVITICLGLTSRAFAQSPEEHAQHHPGAPAAEPAQQPAANATAATAQPPAVDATVTPAMPPSPAPMAPGAGAMESMMKGMGAMMQSMGARPVKELYPALMELPDLPLEKRAELERRAHQRMAEGTRLMGSALTELSSAAGRDDYAAMQEATRRLRQALTEFDSGLAAHRALAEGKAPRNVALTWFKREMNLLGAPPAVTPHGVFGLSAFHYVTMAVIAAFAAFLAAMTWARQRRAVALAAQLTAAPATVPAGAPAVTRLPASSVGGWSGALRVVRIFQETADVKTFRLAPVSGEDLPFGFEPGQFLTVSVLLDGKTVRRSYSIASSPCCHGFCDLTVKHARGGAVSGYLHERVRVGDVLDASGAFGRFTFRGREAPSVVMIAGGVGITPMMSSVRYLTDQSWSGDIFLIYACSRLDAVIFREELEHLARRHPNLHLTFVLSDEPATDWGGARGFVTAELLKNTVPELPTRRVHLCGPPPMMEAVRRELALAGLPEAQLKTELFLSAEVRKAVEAPLREAAAPVTAATCRLARSGKTVALAPDQTVLEAAEAAGVELDYSCRQGFCGVCKARLLEGAVTMAVEDGLAPADKTAGYILTCQAKAQGSVVVDA